MAIDFEKIRKDNNFKKTVNLKITKPVETKKDIPSQVGLFNLADVTKLTKLTAPKTTTQPTTTTVDTEQMKANALSDFNLAKKIENIETQYNKATNPTLKKSLKQALDTLKANQLSRTQPSKVQEQKSQGIVTGTTDITNILATGGASIVKGAAGAVERLTTAQDYVGQGVVNLLNQITNQNKKVTTILPKITEESAKIGEKAGGIIETAKKTSSGSGLSNVGMEYAEVIGNLAPSILLEMVSPGLGTAELFFSASNSYSKDAKQRGLTGLKGEAYADLMGAAETISVRFGLGKLGSALKNIAKKQLVKGAIDVGTGATINAVQEAVMEPLTEVTSQALGGKHDYKDIGKRMLDSGIDGAMVFLIMGGMGSGFVKSTEIGDKLAEGKPISEEEVKEAVAEMDKAGVDTTKIKNSYNDKVKELVENKDKIIEAENKKEEQVVDGLKEITKRNKIVLKKKFEPTKTKQEEKVENIPVKEKVEEIEVKETKTTETQNKQKQFEIIRETNPMHDEQHVGIRSATDIKNWKEAMQDDESFVYGDFSIEDAQKALQEGKVTVYSSKPIENGIFVSTSKNMASDYAGGGKIYSKNVPLEEVAWINGDEGQYAKVTKNKQVKPIETEQAIYESANRLISDKDIAKKLADTIAKISKDRGTAYEFTNDNELKEKGYYKNLQEGKHINGLVTPEGKILINVDSDSAFEEVVGHETTHLLEESKTDYNKYSKAIIDYAKEIGEYDSIKSDISRIYQDTKANVEKEVIATLTGKYIFKDNAFVRKLSVEQPTIFDKVYEYIKHLLKQVTAGSKESRKLEKAKYTFEQLYKTKESAKTGEVKYSIKNNKIIDNNGNEVKLDIADTGKNNILMAMHNLTDYKLKGLLELEGIPTASLAITKAEYNPEQFGEITLLFDKNTINPTDKRNEVYNSDIYSTRFPKTANIIDNKKFDALYDELGNYAYTIKENLQANDLYETRRNIERYLESKKENVTELDIDTLYNKVVATIIRKRILKPDQNIFKPSGERKTIKEMSLPYNLDNLVKIMTKKGTQGSEDNYITAGTIRANMAQRLKSIEEIQSAKQNIISQEEMDKIKEAKTSELDNIVEELKEYYKYDNKSQGYENAYDSINETAKSKVQSINTLKAKLEDNFIITDKIPDKTLQKLLDFLNSLKNMPTQYFESKPQRAIYFDEVQAAIIPNTMDNNLKSKLKDRGINVVEYNPDIKKDRTNKINEFDNLKFSLSEAKPTDKVTPKKKQKQLSEIAKIETKEPFKEEKTIAEKNKQAEKNLTSLIKGDTTSIEIGNTPKDIVESDQVNIIEETLGKIVASNKQNKFTPEKLNQLANKVYSATVDNLHYINLMVKDISKKLDKDIKANENPYILALNGRKSSGTSDYIINKSLVDMNGNIIGESLKSIVQAVPKGKVKEFENYLLHKHNIARYDDGKPVFGKEYTSKMSENVIKELDKKYPEFKSIANRYYDFWNKFMQSWAVDSELIDETSYKNLQKKYPNYVPTYRSFTELEKDKKQLLSIAGRKYVNQAKIIKKAVGSEKPIIRPFESLISNIERITKTARNNEVGKSLYHLADNYEEAVSPWLSKRDITYKEWKALTDNQIEGQVRLGSDGNIEELMEDLGKQYEERKIRLENKQNIVKVMVNGKIQYLEINDIDLLRNLKGMNTTDLGKVGKKIKSATTLFKVVVTGKSPWFALRNVSRDTPSAYINSDSASLIDFSKTTFKEAVSKMATNSKEWQNYCALGGTEGTYYSYSNWKLSNTVNKLSKHEVLVTKIPKKVVNTIFGGANEFTENMNRFAEYLRVIEKDGDTPEGRIRALYASGEVSTNFNRYGALVKGLDAGVPYLNAGIQGIDKSIRQLLDPKTSLKTIAKALISVTAISLLLEVLYGDDEDYKQLSERQKDIYYNIKIPGSDQFIKIPKPNLYGFVFGTLAQRFARFFRGDEKAFDKLDESALSTMTPANPIDNNIFSPLLTYIPKNKDFANRTIVPNELLDLSPELQYDETTSEIGKMLGKVLKQSPKQIDYLIKSYTGVIGETALPLTTKENTTNPFIKNFTTDPVYSNDIYRNFYDNKEEFERRIADAKKLNKQVNKNDKEISKIYNKISGYMSDVNEVRDKLLEGETAENKVEINRNARIINIELARYCNELADSYEEYDKLTAEAKSRLSKGIENALEDISKLKFLKGKE